MTKELLENVDRMCYVIRRSGKHSDRSTQDDLNKIVKELMNNKAMQCMDGRSYKHFVSIKDSMLADFDALAFYKWVNEHKSKVHLKKCAR